MTNIYVGNLSFRATEEDVRKTFAAHGEVASVSIVMDRETGRSRGFAFVEMPNAQQAEAAIQAVHGQEIAGRGVTANEAKPRTDRPLRNSGGDARGRTERRDAPYGEDSGAGRRHNPRG